MALLRRALLPALLAACLASGTGLAAAARTAAGDAAVAAAAAATPEVRLVGRFVPGDDSKPAKLPQVRQDEI